MKVLDIGNQNYKDAWDIQIQTAEAVSSGSEDTLILVEHPPVLTLGASFHAENLLLSAEEYAERGIEVCKTDRGGDVTFHGPGQLVIYPIFDLNRHGRDLHQWLRNLEESIIFATRSFGLSGFRFPPHTGVWVSPNEDDRKKIAAVGIKIRKWVSLHGIALNCSNEMNEFDLIIPCGIQGYGVTSLTEATGRQVSVDDAKEVVIDAFRETFRG